VVRGHGEKKERWSGVERTIIVLYSIACEPCGLVELKQLAGKQNSKQRNCSRSLVGVKRLYRGSLTKDWSASAASGTLSVGVVV
jgi:hypothetical protein